MKKRNFFLLICLLLSGCGQVEPTVEPTQTPTEVPTETPTEVPLLESL